MTVADLLSQLPDLLVFLVSDDPPEDEDVKAGWFAFALFAGLAGAVVILGFSLVKQLRKAQAAKDAGVYGDEPAVATETEPSATDPDEPEPV